ncbi:MAG: hypothetical protein LUC96_10365 [Alistipes sp.]|uniref:hypothetical protein n=1 Tax=Alistipes sp. TaxID=1872444 RepID=UPI0025BA734A|nr:hypothetical protein [Alistipes sp.]MCD7794703.1 hypothetical protein [Alistipes sp.]MCD8275367.1 hypothetical protein [Alistipes sp.]
MTEKQIEAAIKALPRLLEPRTPAQSRQLEELSCREMINSCLIYHSARYDFYDPKTKEFGRYAKDYVESLGEETVVRLYNEQAEDFSKAIVRHGVYTDSEGCTYNSCTWADEQ